MFKPCKSKAKKYLFFWAKRKGWVTCFQATDFQNAPTHPPILIDQSLIDEARLSNAEETAKITALLDRLTFTKHFGKQVDLCATIFGCLATEAEIAADKVVCRYEQRGTSNQQASSYRANAGPPDKAATLEATGYSHTDAKC